MTDPACCGSAPGRDPGRGIGVGDTPRNVTGAGNGGGLVPGLVKEGRGMELVVVASGTRRSHHSLSFQVFIMAKSPASCHMVALYSWKVRQYIASWLSAK